jgi:hypothetical protein
MGVKLFLLVSSLEKLEDILGTYFPVEQLIRGCRTSVPEISGC